jgi:putative polyhydroxyalkanoate system protein
MSSSINVVMAHRLGTDAAKERIASAIPKFEPTFGRAARLEQTAWQGDTLPFCIRAMGVRATGTVAVTENEVRVEAKLPIVLAPFSGLVERLIAEHGGQLLRPPLDRREVVRRARLTARAAGLDWRRLSKEEIALFIEQARQELLKAAASPNEVNAQTGRQDNVLPIG